MLSLLLAAGCFGNKSSGPTGGGTMCMTKAECPQDQYCVSGVCAHPGKVTEHGKCTATRDCATGLYCSAAGTCGAGGEVAEGGSCTADAVCQSPLRCNFSGFFGTCATAGSAEAGADCAASSDCLAGLVCGPGAAKKCVPPQQAYPPFAGVTCADEGPFRVYFEVPRPNKPPTDFYRLPFPNDIRVTNGKLDLSDFPKPGPTPLGVDLVQLYVDAWTRDFDGFSTIGVTTFRFSAPPDDEAMRQDGSLTMIADVTPGAARVEYARGWIYNEPPTKYSCANRLTERNSADAPYLPGHTYAVILTRGITSKKGEAIAVDPDMTALLAESMPADADLKYAWTVYQPLRDFLKKRGATAPSVAAAAVFTVQDAPGHMRRLAKAVTDAPAPVLKDVTVCGAGVKSPCDDGTPARACGAEDSAFTEVHGRFSVPIFQEGTAPYETTGGGIVEEAGVPKVQRTEDVCFALSLPKGTAPAKGWPLMVYHHGTGGSMRSFILDEAGIAAKMAGGTAPSAVFGFDAVEHGARRGASTKKPDDLVFNPLNPPAARDNFLQGAADILQAFRVAGLTIPGAMAGTAADVTFDATKVTYFGHSQGSTSGALAVSMSNAAPLAIFSGAGSFLTHSLLDKTKPVNIAAGMVYLLGEPLDPEHPVLTLFQSYFDRSDPLNYNRLIVANPPEPMIAKHVYMSWGSKDTYTPASTLTANGLSFGASAIAATPKEGATGLPVVGALPEMYYGGVMTARPVSLNLIGGDKAATKVTAAMIRYEAGDYDGHFVTSKNAAAIADWSAFVQSYLATGTPTIP